MRENGGEINRYVDRWHKRKEGNKNNHAMQTSKDLMICFELTKPFTLH